LSQVPTNLVRGGEGGEVYRKRSLWGYSNYYCIYLQFILSKEKNKKLFKQIHDEQDTCVELKVQIRMVTAAQKVETEKPS
jgi:hypothetical protein